MAVPVWVPFALAAASAVANNRAQAKKDDAAANAYRRFQKREDESADAAAKAVQRSIDPYKDAAAESAQQGDDLAAAFKAGQSEIPTGQTANRVSNRVPTTDRVVSNSNRRSRGTRRYTNQLADARGSLMGFDQMMLNNSLTNRDVRSDLNAIQSNRRGNQRNLGMNLEAAAQRGAEWGTAGDLLSMAAMVTTPMALAAQPAAAANAATQAGGVGSMAASTPAAELATEAALMRNPVVPLPSAVAPQSPWYMAMFR